MKERKYERKNERMNLKKAKYLSYYDGTSKTKNSHSPNNVMI